HADDTTRDRRALGGRVPPPVAARGRSGPATEGLDPGASQRVRIRRAVSPVIGAEAVGLVTGAPVAGGEGGLRTERDRRDRRGDLSQRVGERGRRAQWRSLTVLLLEQ